MRVSLRIAATAGAIVLAVSAPALAAVDPAPRPAGALLEAAEARAETAGTNVLILVHASWCGWCTRLERYLQQPEVRRRFDASYEGVWLDALGRPAAGADLPPASPRRREHDVAACGAWRFLDPNVPTAVQPAYLAGRGGTCPAGRVHPSGDG